MGRRGRRTEEGVGEALVDGRGMLHPGDVAEDCERADHKRVGLLRHSRAVEEEVEPWKRPESV